MDHFAFADSVAASSLPFVVLASKSDVIPSHNGARDPVLERYEIHKATPETPRSQKMCIALVLRSVVNNKRGKYCPLARICDLEIWTELLACLLFFFFFFSFFLFSLIYDLARKYTLPFLKKQLFTLVANLGTIPPFWRSTHGRSKLRHGLKSTPSPSAHRGPLSRPPIKRRGGAAWTGHSKTLCITVASGI